MMEPSAKPYKPFREEMMGDRKFEVLNKSGFVWSDLKDMLSSHVDPHHTRIDPADVPKRNDTLLVTANIANFPKKSHFRFENVATMLFYQLLSTIRTSTLFQQYGLVRMLIWTNDDMKRQVLPRALLGRKRSAFEAELACEWVHEVAGHDIMDATSERQSLRDKWMNYESAANALRRMEEAGIATPPGRETSLLKAIQAHPEWQNQKLAGKHAPILERPYMAELEDLEAEAEEHLDEIRTDEEKDRLKKLRYRDRASSKDSDIYLELLQMHDAALALDPSTPEFEAASKAYAERLDGLRKNPRNEYFRVRDGYHLFRYGGPHTLLWDRRAYEPLSIDLGEFYPRAPTCLLDIQPKAMDSVFREHGPTSTRSGDFANLVLRSFFQNTLAPIHPTAMDNAWPGFADMAAEQCPSLLDPSSGGSPLAEDGRLNVRSMNEKQWTELMHAWMRWPFHPDYLHMLGRTVDPEDLGDEAELMGSAQGTA